ncbi:hypothetical protein [Cupriavidus plantarum]|uniref:hypothetical protein n=1 Tax=Cupriavidus plantarum TaxID=942865 RepID=UPI0011B255DA|nr:hypothetical protein [Cupriavidus plantarum]NYH99951.1 hypothetical protein [Cupriavidus plantarum]
MRDATGITVISVTKRKALSGFLELAKWKWLISRHAKSLEKTRKSAAIRGFGQGHVSFDLLLML